MSSVDNKEPVIYWRCRIEPDCGLQVRSVFFLELNKHLPSPRSTMEDYDILLSIATPDAYEAYPTKIEALEAFRRSMLSDIEQVRAEIGAEPVRHKSYGRDDLMAVSAVRYALGRMSYIVSETVDWLIAQQDNISQKGWAIIKRDIEEAFKRDDEDRAAGRDCKALGMDIDRQQWERVRALWRPALPADQGSAEA